MSDGKCRSCGADVIWSPVATNGGLMPLDKQTELAPEAKLVAYNDETGLCRVLKQADVREALLFAEPNVTFHQSHFATCIAAAKCSSRRKDFFRSNLCPRHRRLQALLQPLPERRSTLHQATTEGDTHRRAFVGK